MPEPGAPRSSTDESAEERKARAAQINDVLAQTYPDAHCELDHTDAWQLLVATVLSAQSTDRRVNTVTPTLFARYPTPIELAAADREEVEGIIKSTGFFRAKTDSLLRLSAALLTDFEGTVPASLDQLTTLPGVGRKTANVVLSDAFGIPGITTDTHVIRLAQRFGWTNSKVPEVIERAIGELFDPSEWNRLNHRVIWHGRRCCHARRPACGACPVAPYCPAFGEGPTDQAVAEGLIREPRR